MLGEKKMKYKLSVRRKEFEFSFEEETFKAFKDGLQPFIDLAESFGTPVTRTSNGSKTSKRGGRRPPFIKRPVLELIKKEPQWAVDKSPENFADKLKTQYGVVGARPETVNVVLIRLFKRGLLTRKEIQGKYVYSVLQVPK
jgi:hypothetical protein